MQILYYDCFSGISGDMNLGAMIDLGVDPEYLKAELQKLPMAHEFELQIQRAQKKGIEGTKADVVLKTHTHGHEHEHQGVKHEHQGVKHEHQGVKHEYQGVKHEHQGVKHEHHQGGGGHTHHHHDHRNLAVIEGMIMNSALSDSVKALSMKIFMEVAVAEAKVHGKPIEEVHFHEVGAVDSIVDIVGAAICYEALGSPKVISAPIQLGGGFVKCDHGLMPVPAPATAEILKGIPVKTGLADKEMTTPTGAAILKVLTSEYSNQMSMNILKVGYGLGTREHEFPNVLRAMLLEDGETPKKKQLILETNLDDLNPEIWQWIEGKLFEAGALDVWRETIAMKKGRMGICLKVLCGTEAKAALEEVILTETTAIGLRSYEIEKLELEREIISYEFDSFPIRIKRVSFLGAPLKYKAEYEDLFAYAEKAEISLLEAQKRVQQDLEENTRWKKL